MPEAEWFLSLADAREKLEAWRRYDVGTIMKTARTVVIQPADSNVL